jgi:hypothetical protein
VHAKVIPALKLTPLDMMLANMQWAMNEANELERRMSEHSVPEIALAAFKELARIRDRAQSYAVRAAPYVHPRVLAVNPAPEPERPDPLWEADPLREHMDEMAKSFGLNSTN